jgi:UPF0716 family protein affecting phage T7 exclusion
VFLAIWGGYVAWNALFVWLAWRMKTRVLLVAGIAMLLAFGLVYGNIADQMSGADYHRSADMAAGLLVYAAGAVLLLPLVLSAIVYPVARFLRRWGPPE